jgi:6-phosphogluconate dehydrogenase
MTEIGVIGLGRMGGNMVGRMCEQGDINVHVWNRSPEKVEKAVKQGATGYKSIPELIEGLSEAPKVVWLMLPSGEVTENAFQQVLGLLNAGDIIIDGANSNFHDTLRRHKQAKERDIQMLDVGVSGGIVAADTGYPMMIGGQKDTYEYCKPIFASFGLKEGYNLVGPGGAGHYVKMIHNAIEYGMMQSIAEGFDLLANGRFKDIDLTNVAHIWNHGCIVESFLMRMTEQALKEGNLDQLEPYVDDSGEGRWSAIEAMEYSVPFVANSYALHARYISRDDNSLAFRMLAAIRKQFGGHAVKTK